jgi:uncharacterized membrane protein
MIEKHGLLIFFSVVLFVLAVMTVVLLFAAVLLRFDPERMNEIRKILKTLILFSLLFFVIGWLFQP